MMPNDGRHRRRTGTRLAWALAAVCLVLTSACGPRVGRAEREAPGGNAAAGARALDGYGCGACHQIPGIPGASAVVGPPLDGFEHRQYIAGALPNTPENLIRWIMNPQAVEPGTIMPDLGVSEAEARDMAAYLYSR